MDMREYLRNHRDPARLNEILTLVIEGVQQIHNLGFVHRDLKPDNIILNLDPLEVRVIDFNRSLIDSTTSSGSIFGTPGYYPSATKWRDGSRKWDIWSLAAIILEADMDLDEYLHTRDERGALSKFHQHSLHPHTCYPLRDLV